MQKKQKTKTTEAMIIRKQGLQDFSRDLDLKGHCTSPSDIEKHMPKPCVECRKKDKIISQLLPGQKHTSPKQLYFDETWLSKRWGSSKKGLQAFRLKGDGPHFYKFSGMIRYRMRDIVAYEKSARRNSTSTPGIGGSNA